jgi:hypothetical protein
VSDPKYTVNVFTEKWASTKFPENTYGCMTAAAVEKIIVDCSRKISGIRKIEVWINYYDKE